MNTRKLNIVVTFLILTLAGCGQADNPPNEAPEIIEITPEAATSTTAVAVTPSTAAPKKAAPKKAKSPKLSQEPQGLPAEVAEPAPAPTPALTPAPEPAAKAVAKPAPAKTAPPPTVVTTATTCPSESASTAAGWESAIACRGRNGYLVTLAGRVKPEAQQCFLAAFEGVTDAELAASFADKTLPPGVEARLAATC